MSRRLWWVTLGAVVVIALLVIPLLGSADVVIGSKAFPESVILGEMLQFLAETDGMEVEHKQGLGSTQIVFDALRSGAIDAYVEYTGTLRSEIYREGDVATPDGLRARLAADGIVLGPRLGFSNSYAIGMLESVADQRGIKTLSDLAKHTDLGLGFTHEFLERGDGWKGLAAQYGIDAAPPRGLEHSLAYEGLVAGEIDATDFYSTDGKIAEAGLLTLEDDQGYFPSYEAVILYRADLAERHPGVVEAFARLDGHISEEAMQEMNAAVSIGEEDEGVVAARFLKRKLQVQTAYEAESVAARLMRQTVEHLGLVVTSLAFAIVIGVGLGVLAERVPRLEPIVMGVVNIAQTVPSLALLALLVPLVGLGWFPAAIALFLYSLLPIVRNTHAGLRGIPRFIRESAQVIGLEPRDILWRVELPLAARSILAGIKTAAVINVGTATLGGLIGAGGYGETIVTGLRSNNNALLLQGAIASMVLALLVDRGFGFLESRVVSKGLRSD